ncbi:MAG: hypothetical protein LLF28_02815 [Nitrospiraceae bacterium]|nr:hypothetical protein [Nitrospiraceae bacterium]
MKKIIVLCLCLFLLPGCFSVSDAFQWISDFFSAYLSDFVCLIITAFFDFLNQLAGQLNSFLSGLLNLLPQYQPPSFHISDFMFIQYAAYFLPISEGATLIKYFIAFYSSFWVGRVILRWLKILK